MRPLIIHSAVFAPIFTLAFSDAARAAIVHTVPPAPITATAYVPDTSQAAMLDFNNDGVPEMSLNAYHASGFPGDSVGTYLRMQRTGVQLPEENEDLVRLAAGAPISPAATFAYFETTPFNVWYGIAGTGEWEYNAPPSYFGFRFEIGGEWHYGWALAQITFASSPPSYSATVLEYAYEGVPGVGIAAGQIPAPSAAGVLVLGVLGICRRRRGG